MSVIITPACPVEDVESNVSAKRQQVKSPQRDCLMWMWSGGLVAARNECARGYMDIHNVVHAHTPVLFISHRHTHIHTANLHTHKPQSNQPEVSLLI